MAELNNVVKVEVGDKEFICRVAVSEYEREYGLMGIDKLSENEGMLFIYNEPQDEISYWMKDTPLHLDIIFISPEMEVISSKEGVPNSTEVVSEKNVLLVLEVPYGSEIEEGDEVDIEDLEDYLDIVKDRFKIPEEAPDGDSDDIKSIEDIIEILDHKGKVQYNLKGGERIFSRKNSKILIRQAKKAEKLKTDSAYKRLGKSLFKYMKIQDENEPKYVKVD